MPTYRYLIVDASTGDNLCELPLTVTSPITRVLNGVGTLSATVPLEHPAATQTNLEGDREISVLRDDSPVWNGPIVSLNPLRSSGVVTIGAEEYSTYLWMRTLEIDQSFIAQDLWQITNWLLEYMGHKDSSGNTSGGTSINALTPRFNVTPFSTDPPAGVTKTVAYAGADRRFIGDIIMDLVNDPTSGCDFRMDYVTGSTRQSCQRTITFATPSLGQTLTTVLTENLLVDYGYVSDRKRAATRVHLRGSGYVSTQQNTGSVTAGELLLERTFDRPDLTDTSQIDAAAKDLRRACQPPVHVYSVAFTPGAALPYGWCDLGDTIPINISGPGLLAMNDSRRVIQIGLTPPTDQTPERVDLAFNVPMDRLGV